jgi:hypothetical protein
MGLIAREHDVRDLARDPAIAVWLLLATAAEAPPSVHQTPLP